MTPISATHLHRVVHRRHLRRSLAPSPPDAHVKEGEYVSKMAPAPLESSMLEVGAVATRFESTAPLVDPPLPALPGSRKNPRAKPAVRFAGCEPLPPDSVEVGASRPSLVDSYSIASPVHSRRSTTSPQDRVKHGWTSRLARDPKVGRDPPLLTAPPDWIDVTGAESVDGDEEWSDQDIDEEFAAGVSETESFRCKGAARLERECEGDRWGLSSEDLRG